MVQTTFAQLRQSDPAIAPIYTDRRLWDDLAAADAGGAALAIRQRRRAAAARPGDDEDRRPSGHRRRPFRLLLTIGEALWFPIVQPVLERLLNGPVRPTLHDIAMLLVPLLGASYLLHSTAFLVIWFVAHIRMFLRWDTQRRVNRLLKRWATADVESELSLTGTCATGGWTSCSSR